MVLCVVLICICAIIAVSKYVYDIVQSDSRCNFVYDLPKIEYKAFVSFYKIKPEVWDLKRARVIKNNIKGKNEKETWPYISYVSYYSYSFEDECSFRFSFLDYWKYKVFKTKVSLNIARKESDTKHKKDLEKLEQLIESVKNDISGM